MPAGRRLYSALAALYALGFAATMIVLFAVERNYVPFDASGLMFVHPRLPQHAELADAFAGASLLWFAAFAALVLVLLRENTRTTIRRVVILIAIQALAGAAFVTLPLAIDSDQFAYVGYAYAANTANPYVRPTLDAHATPAAVTVAKHWGNPLPVDRYGGGWTLFNAVLLDSLRTSSAQTQATVLRLAALLAGCAVTLLVAVSPRRIPFGAVVSVGLNPLVILETANGAHNDIFLVLAGVVAIYFAVRERFGIAGLLIGVATAVKFAYAPFIAPLVALAFRRGAQRSTLALCIGGFVAVTTLLSAPFGWRHGPMTEPLTIMRSAPGVLAHLTPVATLALAAAVIVMTLEAARGRLNPWLLVVITLLLLATPGKVEAWYPLIAIPLAIVPSIVTRSAFLAFSALGLVLAQSNFLGTFPLIEALAAAAATATICIAVFHSRRARPLTA